MNKKIAIVTGGASGIGLAIAKKFCEQEVLSILVGRQAEKLQRAAESLGANAIPFPFDITRLDAIPRMIAEIIQRFGQIDILVNNAGINMKKPLLEVSDVEFELVMQTNLNAVFSLSRECARYMVERKSGAIIHISSMAARYGLPKVIAYSASKTAIDGMTRAMAVELSPLGVRVNAIAPGFIITEMTDKAFNADPERRERALDRTPLGYMGQPGDVAEAAWFLASDAARYITGVVLPVDGGNSIGF
ncbi:MAG: SDR family NAD(P)-dependent oxidoreductase [Chitinophagaceae bacterium]